VSATPQAVVPAAPTQLIATRNKPGRISLRWIQSTTPGLTSNGIYRRTDPDPYPASPTFTISPNTAYQDNSVIGGTTYCYRVTAISAAGGSAQSNESCATAK
jgi:fibronectin type 3 domain-containing protein